MHTRRIALASLVVSLAVLAGALGVGLGGEGVSDRPAIATPTSVDPITRSASDGLTAIASDEKAAPDTTRAPAAEDEVAGQSEPMEQTAIPAVQVRSGRVEDILNVEQRVPIGLRIGDLSIDAPVEPVGYDTSSDLMEVPRSAGLVGWYQFSASPGDSGSSVLAAHVDWNGRAGVFYELYRLGPGAIVTVAYDDGSESRFEVVATEQYSKEILPIADIFTREGDPMLTLITCGGDFDPSARTYDDNVVVYARPVDTSGSDKPLAGV